MTKLYTYEEIVVFLQELLKHHLTLAQASLTDHQYTAFRRLAFDHFAFFKKELLRGQSGKTLNNGKGGGAMSG